MKEIFESFLPYIEVMVHVTLSVLLFVIAIGVVFFVIKGIFMLSDLMSKKKVTKKKLLDFSDEVASKMSNAVSNAIEVTTNQQTDIISEMICRALVQVAPTMVEEIKQDPRETICGVWRSYDEKLELEILYTGSYFKFFLFADARADRAKSDNIGAVRLEANEIDRNSVFILDGYKFCSAIIYDAEIGRILIPALGKDLKRVLPEIKPTATILDATFEVESPDSLTKTENS